MKITPAQSLPRFPDEADAHAYWDGKEFKKWAVDVTAGPEKRPTYRRTFYVQSRTETGAIAGAKSNMIDKVRGARYRARLAGPRELGCHRVTPDTTPAELHALAARWR